MWCTKLAVLVSAVTVLFADESAPRKNGRLFMRKFRSSGMRANSRR